MNSAICTLFEGHYHIGVATLVNSLFLHGFRGTVIAGHRGDLPPWAAGAHAKEEAQELMVAAGLTLRFVRVAQPGHLTNLKPHFMLEAWEKHAAGAEGLLYFDPDIVV